MVVEVYNYLDMVTFSVEEKDEFPTAVPAKRGASLCGCCGASFNSDKIGTYPQGTTIDVFTSKEELDAFLTKSPNNKAEAHREFYQIKTSFGDLHLMTQMCAEQQARKTK